MSGYEPKVGDKIRLTRKYPHPEMVSPVVYEITVSDVFTNLIHSAGGLYFAAVDYDVERIEAVKPEPDWWEGMPDGTHVEVEHDGTELIGDLLLGSSSGPFLATPWSTKKKLRNPDLADVKLVRVLDVPLPAKGEDPYPGVWLVREEILWRAAEWRPTGWHSAHGASTKLDWRPIKWLAPTWDDLDKAKP